MELLVVSFRALAAERPRPALAPDHRSSGAEACAGSSARAWTTCVGLTEAGRQSSTAQLPLGSDWIPVGRACSDQLLSHGAAERAFDARIVDGPARTEADAEADEDVRAVRADFDAFAALLNRQVTAGMRVERV